MKTALLLYPHQLFAVSDLPKDIDEVVLVEEPLLFGTDKKRKMYFHKQKLVFHRATMVRYMEEELWPAGYQVDYIEFKRLDDSGDIVEKLKEFDKVHIFELDDDTLGRRLKSALDAHPQAPEIEPMKSPNFFLDSDESAKFFSDTKNASFPKFYQWQRERFNILIDTETYKPLEGKFMCPPLKRQRLSKAAKLPSFQVYGSNQYIVEARKYVEQNFPDNPGTVSDFPWPTNRHEARVWLKEFLEGRLGKYALYQEAVDSEASWMYHSAISPTLNVGLLQAKEVIDAALEIGRKQDVPIESMECFVRYILGWREFSRGEYKKRHVTLRATNSFGHNRHMTIDWYKGTTGLQPVDDVIKKTLSRAYVHHIERHMVLGNIMFLCEFHPDEIFRWFMEMFIDSYDWITVPNVYGVSQGAAFDTLGTPPSISSSNFIMSMSHYKKGEWSDTWDGLYWRAIDKHRLKFEKTDELGRAVKQLDRMNKNRRRIIGYRAEDFLRQKTTL